MNFEELDNFIRNKMSMTHIYQPVMIRKLLESGGRATVEEIAREFIDMDDSLLEYYKGRVMVWPKITLKKHNVVSYDRGTFTLLLDGITREERSRLVDLCRRKTDEYVEKYENRIGVMSNRIPISGSIRYEVLARSKGVCVLCGVTSRTRPMDVDHIIPASAGGTNDISNLQVLCFKCNRQKRDRDRTNFVQWHKRLKYRDARCFLCSAEPIKSNAMASAIRKGSAISRFHSMIFPHRHVGTFFDLIPAEKSHCIELVEDIKEEIIGMDDTVDGFNVNFDSRLAPNQHMHCHINIIPHRQG